MSPPSPRGTGFLGWPPSSDFSPSQAFILLLLSGYEWSDFSQRCSSAIVQALLRASLFSNFFSEAVLLNKKNLVQAATCHMSFFCQERMCHSSSAKKKKKGKKKKEKLLLVSFFFVVKDFKICINKRKVSRDLATRFFSANVWWPGVMGTAVKSCAWPYQMSSNLFACSVQRSQNVSSSAHLLCKSLELHQISRHFFKGQPGQAGRAKQLGQVRQWAG